MKSFIYAFLIIFFGAGCGSKEWSPGKYGPVGDFSLHAVTVEKEFPIRRKDLLGKVWIANFIFTSCNGPCPILSQGFENLQKELPESVSFVTFTIDPHYDTAQRLRQYAKRYHADPKRWIFVRGEKAPLYELFEKGFQIVAAEDKSTPLAEKFMHTSKYVLVDQGGEIRGYFFGDNPSGLNRVKESVLKLLSE